MTASSGFVCPIKAPTPGLLKAKKLIEAVFYCTPAAECNYDPSTHGLGLPVKPARKGSTEHKHRKKGPVERKHTYGLYQLGLVEMGRCGSKLRSGQVVPDCNIYFQVQCAVQEMMATSKRDRRLRGLRALFAYWQPLYGGDPTFDACMTGQGYPGWAKDLDGMSADPCKL